MAAVLFLNIFGKVPLLMVADGEPVRVTASKYIVNKYTPGGD
jgi:hypothetical protein